MAFIDRFKKKKKTPVQFGPKFFAQLQQRYALEDGGLAEFVSENPLEGAVDVVPVPEQRALYLSLPPDARKEAGGPEQRQGEIVRVTVNGRRTGTRYGLEGRIVDCVRAKPKTELGALLGISQPGTFYKLELTAKPSSLDERVDFRFVPPYMLHLLHSLEQSKVARGVPRYIRSYLMPLRKKAARGGLRYVLSDVEVRLWNPAGEGRMVPSCPRDEEALEGPGPPLTPMGRRDTPLEVHRTLVEGLRRTFEEVKGKGRPKEREEPRMEVQLFGTTQTAQKMIRGLSATQFVNLGPVAVDGLEATDSDKLYIDGRLDLGDEGPKGGLSRNSTLYLTTNIDGRRLICPYRYSTKRTGNKHALQPLGEAFADDCRQVDYLDLSRSGIRIVIDREGLESLVGRTLPEAAYEALFAEGNRLLEPLEAGTRPGNLEELVRSLSGRIVGLNLHINFGRRDFSIYMGEATDDKGNRRALYSDHFPERVSPLVSFLAEIKNVMVATSEENVLTLGLVFGFRLLSGDPFAAAQAAPGPFIWQRIGPQTAHDLVAFTEAIKTYHDKRVQVSENGKGMDAVIAFQLQAEMEKARNSPATRARMAQLDKLPLDDAPVPAKATRAPKPTAPKAASKSPAQAKAKAKKKPRDGVVSLNEKGFFSSLKTIVFSPEKIKVIKKK